MFHVTGNKTVFVGLETVIIKTIASALNFSIEFSTPPGKQKWGILDSNNSTGLLGMLQRTEIDVGFGVTGLSPDHSNYLRSSFPSVISQLTMAIPPRNPYTSLEKMFLPFTASSWTLIVVCYSVICGFSNIVFYIRHHSFYEKEQGMIYITWVILMGGPGSYVRRHSSRIYVISLVLNAFIVRNFYQSSLFRYLRSNDNMASKLNTYEDINNAGLCYYMYPTIKHYFVENPWMIG
ncbi:uncharacterized protein LOC131214508, partial [Anopheles bellator]|uniref:uncharacterized protein LOC131214508 n=1 Tax=Anopheles bellator TaxID=139047 RepID=UPI0026486A83